MGLRQSILSSVLLLGAAGAQAQTRNIVVHLDGSCMGMNLHVTNGLNVTGTSFGCGDAGMAFAGRIKPGRVADVTAHIGALAVKYRIGLNHNDWAVYETIDGTQEKIGDGFLTKLAVSEMPLDVIAAK